jgi:hypothetical protein
VEEGERVAYRTSAPKNFPSTIWKSVSGEVRRSSMVPERISSANERMVSMGTRNRRTTLVVRRT